MDAGIDASPSVTPYVLCSLCQQVAATYSPDQACVPREKLLELYDGTHPENLTDTELYWATREPLKHHKSIDDLRQAAANGCHLCALWVRSFDHHNKRLSFSALGQLFVSPDRDTNTRKGPMFIADRRSGRVRSFHDFWLVLSQELPLPEPERKPLAWMHISRAPTPIIRPWETRTCYPFSPVPDRVDRSLVSAALRFRWCQNTGAPESYHMIAQCMQNCVTTHALCSQRISSRSPARLLDLFNCPGPGSCRLVETYGVDSHPYAALSYRWGNCSTITLTDDNYSAFLAGILIDRLPKTIQEAIIICKSLSIRYLWVDALCIEQNNTSDFTQEITRMGSIYAGSLVTIAAADSADCESGCFRERVPLQHEDCHFWESENEAAYFGRKFGCTADFWNPDYIESRELETLDRRAWVFQERMMSPRTIHYGKHDVYWECRCGIVCQNCTLNNRAHKFIRVQDPPKETFTSLYNLPTVSTSDTRQAFIRLWAGILLSYTQTQLTYEDDRLSALAGVAEVVGQKLNYKASFGLWQEVFMEELMWCVNRGRLSSSSHNDQLKDVPSWSWAAVRSAVHLWPMFAGKSIWGINREAKLVKLPQATEFDRISAIVDQHRSLGSSTVKIKGWITECEPLPPRSQSIKPLIPIWELIHCNEKLSKDDEERLESRWEVFHSQNAKGPATSERIGQSTSCISYYPHAKPCQRAVVTCLHLRRIVSRDAALFEQLNDGLGDYGLVLQRIDLNQNRYRRLGVFLESVSFQTFDSLTIDKAETHDDLQDIVARCCSHMRLFGTDPVEAEMEIV